MRKNTNTHGFARLRALLCEHWMLLLLLTLAASVRLWQFGSIPPGFNQDEASTAYDAWALLHYGIDRNGFSLPVVLVSWGSGMYILAALLAMPSLALFGLSVFAARLPMVVVGIATILVFAAVCSKRGKGFGMLGAFLLAVSPWHVMLSRWALDSNVLPACLLLSTWALLRALDRKRPPVLAGALFGVCLYAYGTAYFVVPMYLASAFATLLALKRITWRDVAKSTGTFLLVASPVIAFLAINQFHLPSLDLGWFSIPRLPSEPRYSSFPTIFGEQALAGIWQNARTLWRVLAMQDDGTTYNVLPWYGYAYIWTGPLLLLGLVAAMRRAVSRRSTVDILFLLWLASFLLLGLMIDVNVNRINGIFLPLLYLLAAGIESVLKIRWLSIGIIVGILCSFIAFTHAYFTEFPRQIESGFFASFGEAIDDATEHTHGPVCVTDQVNMPYIYVLFSGAMDPRRFLSSVQYDDPRAEFRSVRSFDRFTFGLDRCAGRSFDAYVLTREEADRFDPATFAIRRFGLYASAKPSQTH